MKCIVRQTFSISIGDVTRPDFSIVERWQGMTRLVNAAGQSVIVDGDPSGTGYESNELTIVKAAPLLLVPD